MEKIKVNEENYKLLADFVSIQIKKEMGVKQNFAQNIINDLY